MQVETERLDRRTILALGAMGAAVLVIANDFTALTSRCRRSSTISTPSSPPCNG
jgi:hypothetical protein